MYTLEKHCRFINWNDNELTICKVSIQLDDEIIIWIYYYSIESWFDYGHGKCIYSRLIY